MNHDGVLSADLSLKLSDGLQKRLALDIADRSSDLDNRNGILLLRLRRIKPGLDLIRNVRDDLNGSPAVIAVSFLVQYGPVHLACRHIGIPVQTFIDKSLIMSQIQIGLRAVVGDKHFSVLDRVHGTRVHVDIGIKFLHRHMISARLQQSSQGSCRNSLSKSRHHAAGHKYILYHTVSPSSCNRPFILRWLRSWKARGRKDRSHHSPPMSCSASRNLRSSQPVPDRTVQTGLCTAGTPW